MDVQARGCLQLFNLFSFLIIVLLDVLLPVPSVRHELPRNMFSSETYLGAATISMVSFIRKKSIYFRDLISVRFVAAPK